MKKKLVSAENITDFLDAGTNEIYVDNTMILTSGAKDYLRDKKVKLVYTRKAAAEVGPGRKSNVCRPEDLKSVVTKIVSILRKDLQVSDADKIERVTQKVLCDLKRR